MADRATSFYSSYSTPEVRRLSVWSLMASASLLLLTLEAIAQETVGTNGGPDGSQSIGGRGEYRIIIAEPVVELVPLIEVKRRCGTTLAKYACTLFQQALLLAQCRAVGSRWVIDTTVSLAPVMIVSRPSYLAHELLHQHDLQESLDLHLSELAGREFSEHPDCLRAAGRAIGLFPSDFNTMKRLSNERRDMKVAAKRGP